MHLGLQLTTNLLTGAITSPDTGLQAQNRTDTSGNDEPKEITALLTLEYAF